MDWTPKYKVGQFIKMPSYPNEKLKIIGIKPDFKAYEIEGGLFAGGVYVDANANEFLGGRRNSKSRGRKSRGRKSRGRKSHSGSRRIR